MELFGLFFALVLTCLIIWALHEPIQRLLLPRRWDIFISHRSTDKVIVDSVVKSLRKQGLRVWFDLTEISESEASQDRFRYKISQGMQQSPVALLFTSGEYCKSVYCQQEVWFLIRRFSNQAQRMIEIRLGENDAREILGIPAAVPLIDMRQHRLSGDADRLPTAIAEEVILLAKNVLNL
jgi:hypothetical protein